jgi:hypothetical protein
MLTGSTRLRRGPLKPRVTLCVLHYDQQLGDEIGSVADELCSHNAFYSLTVVL